MICSKENNALEHNPIDNSTSSLSATELLISVLLLIAGFIFFLNVEL